MTAHRVVITGLGTVAPPGLNVPAFAAKVFAGTSAITRVKFERSDGAVDYPGGMVEGFVPEALLDSKKVPFMDRFAQFAVVAAREAMADAKLMLTPDEGLRTATIIGSGVG